MPYRVMVQLQKATDTPGRWRAVESVRVSPHLTNPNDSHSAYVEAKSAAERATGLVATP